MPDLEPADVPPSTPPESRDAPGGPGRLAGLALAAGLVAGIASWLAGEGVLSAFRAELNPKIQRGGDPEAARRFARAHLLSGSAAFAALGAILGLSLGLAGGLGRRSAPAGARATLFGGVAGAVAGASASWLALPHFFGNYDPQSQDLTLPILTLGSVASSVGASAGLAFGIGLGGRGRVWKSAAGGLIGGLMGAVAYEVVGALAFPTSKTELPISHALETRALFHVLVAVLASVGVALSLGLSSRRSDPAPPGA